MANEETALKERTVLKGRYVIDSKIGRGGCGITYRATDRDQPGLGLTVVVKQFAPNSSKQRSVEKVAALRVAFEKEASILKRLGDSYRCIPKVVDFFEEGGNLYIVQEFIKGVDLSNILTKGNILSEIEAIELIRKILTILKDVHNQNIIHRDIKPENIRKRETHENELVLIDFGISKEILDSNDIGQLTEWGAGTPGYRPPEQEHGKPTLASDIYPIGIIGLQAITGLKVSELSKFYSEKEGVILPNIKIQATSGFIEFLKYTLTHNLELRYTNATKALESLNNLDRIVPFDIAVQNIRRTDTESNVVKKTTSKRSKAPLAKVIGTSVLLIGVISGLIEIFGAAPKVVEMLSGSEKQWKIYHSDKYGVQLSHPQNWTRVLEDSDKERGSLLTLYPPGLKTECRDKVVIEITQPEKHPSSLEMHERNESARLKEINQGVDINHETTDKTQLSSISAFRLSYQREDLQCGMRKVVEISTFDSGQTYSVLYNSGAQNFERDQATFEKIVDNFKIDK
jgi:eukaryotic-like serine/threonine-protein kinase